MRLEIPVLCLGMVFISCKQRHTNPGQASSGVSSASQKSISVDSIDPESISTVVVVSSTTLGLDLAGSGGIASGLKQKIGRSFSRKITPTELDIPNAPIKKIEIKAPKTTKAPVSKLKNPSGKKIEVLEASSIDDLPVTWMTGPDELFRTAKLPNGRNIDLVYIPSYQYRYTTKDVDGMLTHIPTEINTTTVFVKASGAYNLDPIVEKIQAMGKFKMDNTIQKGTVDLKDGILLYDATDGASLKVEKLPLNYFD